MPSKNASKHIPQDYMEFRNFNIVTNTFEYPIPNSLPQRPNKFNNLGREINLTLNTFNVLQAPNTIVHQYDVAWGAGTDSSKRVLIKKIWNSKAVKAALGEPQNLWIYDGNKLAW